MQHASKKEYSEALCVLNDLPKKYGKEIDASILRLIVLFGLKQYEKLLSSVDQTLDTIAKHTRLSKHDKAYLTAYVRASARGAYILNGGDDEHIPEKYVGDWGAVQLSLVSRHLVRNFKFQD